MNLRTLLATALAAGLLAPPSTLNARPAKWSLVAVPVSWQFEAELRWAPWFGTWQLDSAKSTKRSDPAPYKKVTSRIEPHEDGLKVTYDMVGTRGGVTHMEWTGRFDGKDYAVQGVDYVLTNAYRRIDDRSYEIVVKVDGQLAAIATAVVSPDGKILTVATAERAGPGQTVNTTAVYERQ